jgi:two-component system chemotaxis response regulator CheB
LSEVIRVLVVDDSAFLRKVVREMLSRSPYIDVVGAARDGAEALELVQQLHPHVVTCDLAMPRLDGLAFVREQMARRPLPILILSVANQDAATALQALEAGAVDFVQKPTALASEDLLRIREELIEKVKAAAHAPVRPRAPEPQRASEDPHFAVPRTYHFDAVVIGISTGGPQALRAMLPRIPANFPVPIAIVLHMPLGFTALFAEKLDEICPLTVKEAAQGDLLIPGQVLVAQAGRHLALQRSPVGVVANLSRQPAEGLHRPSVDVLFQSASQIYGERLLGVIMTGMGSDGREGAAWIKAQGGTILTEAEKSCVIYGMPRSVMEAGLSDAAIPLDEMAQAIINKL